MSRLVNSIEELIGDTPVIEIQDSLIPSGKRLFLKLESSNPTFSIKDRTALAMVKSAEVSGKLAPGGTIIESTSGNLGKSLAMIGAARGYKVIVVIDPKVSASIINWYKAFGAEVDLVTVADLNGGFQSQRIARVQELLREHPNAYWPNQYENPDNWEGHANSTGPEVLSDFVTVGADTLVGSVSTGGHLSGIASYFRQLASSANIIAADVVGSAVFGGQFSPYLINGLGLGWRAANTKVDLFDSYVHATDQQAIALSRRLARRHGLLVGGSSGLVCFAAVAALRQHERCTIALAVLPDSGVSYLSQYFDLAWREANEIHLPSDPALASCMDSCLFNSF